jgi:hypothetical protein
MNGTTNKGHGETDLARTNPDTFLNGLDLRRLHKSTQAVGSNVMHTLLIYELLLFLFNKEGITQEDPLSMFAYNVGILALIRVLKQEFPEFKQPSYVDDAGAGGKYDAIWQLFIRL